MEETFHFGGNLSVTLLNSQKILIIYGVRTVDQHRDAETFFAGTFTAAFQPLVTGITALFVQGLLTRRAAKVSILSLRSVTNSFAYMFFISQATA